MRIRSLPSGVAAAVSAVVLALMAQSVTLRAAPTNAAAGTNFSTKPDLLVQPPFVEPPIPQAVFVIPKKPSEGKDPFFPKSTRPYGVDPTVPKSGPAPVVAELLLRGISGTPEHPLAIINTTTFTIGEENDVLTKAGRMRIRCLEINMTAGTVLIQVGGERRELRLPPLR